MSNDIPGGGFARTGVWTNEWMGSNASQARPSQTANGPQPSNLPQGTNTTGNWLYDLLDAQNNPAVNVDLGSLGGNVPFPPTTENGTHPMGSLKVNNGVIETAGGYKIEATKRHEWIITGPDGRSTRIWGDPHVDESDGGKWDFKRSSTFVLGDGTQIHCTTKPWGDKGWTVTGELEIVSGNERVKVTGIDEGKGKVGEVTNDGYSRAGHLESDVFVMGKDSDDWALMGEEINGSEKQGEVIKTTGKQLMVGYSDWNVADNRFFKGFHGVADPLDSQKFLQYMNQFMGEHAAPASAFQTPPGVTNPYDGTGTTGAGGTGSTGGTGGTQTGTQGYDVAKHLAALGGAFQFVGSMFNIIHEMMSLRDQALNNQRYY